MKLFYIGAFGLLGVYARYATGLLAAKYLASPFPHGTFLINIVGSFLIGVAYVLGAERSVLSADLRIGIAVGFLGGFTTFSSYSLEISRLIEERELWCAGLYFSLSSILGILGAFSGLYLARKFFNGGAA